MVLADGAGAELYARLRLLFQMHARGVAAQLARGRVPPLSAVPPPAPPPPVAVPAEGLGRARRHAAAAAAVAALDADDSSGGESDGAGGGAMSTGSDGGAVEGDTLGGGGSGVQAYGRPRGISRTGMTLALGLSSSLASNARSASVVGSASSSRSASPTGASERASYMDIPPPPLSGTPAVGSHSGMMTASSPVTPYHAPHPSTFMDVGGGGLLPPEALGAGHPIEGGMAAAGAAIRCRPGLEAVAPSTGLPAPPAAAAAATAAAAAAGVARANADAARLLYAYRSAWLAYAAGVDTAAAVFGLLDRAWSAERAVGGPLAVRGAEVMDVRSMALLAWRQQLFGSVGGALVEAALTVIGASRVRRAAALDDRIAGKAGVAGGLLGCPTPNGDGLCGCPNAACAERDVPPLDWLPTAVPGLDAVSDLLGSLVVMGPARSAAAAADGGGVGAPSAMLPLLSRLRAINLREPNVAVVPASAAAGASERRGPGTMWASPAWASQAQAPPLPGLPVAVGDMELYRSAFERKFLDSTTAYFTAESARLLGRLPSPVTYVWAVETVVRRAELAASVGVYAAAETTPRLAKALDGALVGAHAPRLTGLVPALLLDGRSADLRTLHALLVRLPAGSLRPVQDCLRSVVHAAGTAAVAPHLPGVRPPPPPPPPSTAGGTGASGSVVLAATPAATDGDVYHDAVGVAATEEEEVGARATAFVSAAWGVYKRYAGVVASAFGADAAFTDALDRGCARFLNAADSTAPITLALYCHAVLSGALGGRGGDRGAVDGDLLGPWVGRTRAAAANPADPVEEAALVRYRLACVTRLFRFVDDKSAFLAEYATCLARRLVVASAPAVSEVAACLSAAAAAPVGGGGWRMDAERAMLGDLRDTVGPAYTSPLLRMLADLDVSRDENVSFSQLRVRGRSCPGGGGSAPAAASISVLVLTAGAWPLPSPPPLSLLGGGGRGGGGSGSGVGGGRSSGRDSALADAPFSPRACAERALYAAAAVTAVAPDLSATLLPRAVQDASASWAKHYLTVHAGRRLTWLPALATVDVAWFGETAATGVSGHAPVAATGATVPTQAQAVLTTTPAQAAVLLLFNATPCRTVAQLEAAAPRVPRVAAVAHSLVAAGVLVASPAPGASAAVPAGGGGEVTFWVAARPPHSANGPTAHTHPPRASTVPSRHLPAALAAPYALASGGLGGDRADGGDGGSAGAGAGGDGSTCGGGGSGSRCRAGDDDARMRVQAAVACAAKAARSLTRAALVEAVRAALAPRFDISEVAVGVAIEALVERELLALTPAQGGTADANAGGDADGDGGGCGHGDDVVDYVL